MMVLVLGWLVAAVFLLLALAHLRWAFGGGAASTAVVPEVDGRPAFNPGRGVTLLVAAALAIAAGLVAMTAGLVPRLVPVTLLRLAMYGLALVLLARAIGDFRLVGFAKRVRGTRFARLDTLVYSPLCLALAAGVAIVALRAGS
jgi:hypothetical protein